MDSATIVKNAAQTGHLVVMGVAGCGKSSLAQACARSLGWRLIEGDDFHSVASIEKMRNGVALTDVDREGWLQRLGGLLQSAEGGTVLTCSALRQRYRNQLRAAMPGLRFVFLELDLDAAQERVRARPGHLFPPSLVASQFATLESPVGEPGVLRLDALRPLDALCADLLRWMAQAESSTNASQVPQ